MSGTSLDGLDVAHCNFSLKKGKWNYKILAAKTFSYSKEWKEKLSSVEKKSAEELAQLHSEYGYFTGEFVKKFISEFKVKADFVASHGHTIFHQPGKKSWQLVAAVGSKKIKTPFTFQLGNGAAIAVESGLPVVCDFRTTDVALGGQGAPLVPIGDKLLFSEYDFCLNIGGIANVTRWKTEGRRREKKKLSLVAFDICAANMVLNFLSHKLGKEYDKNGAIAKSGKVNKKLFKELNALKYYSLKAPKSLGKEWFMKEFFPVLNKYKISVEDKMRTAVEHIAFQISSQFKKVSGLQLKILITGGGAHNKFLVERMKENLDLRFNRIPNTHRSVSLKCPLDICRPDKLTIDFKEALIFAFLGVLRIRNENNCLASVTGASRDNCGGAIYLP